MSCVLLSVLQLSGNAGQVPILAVSGFVLKQRLSFSLSLVSTDGQQLSRALDLGRSWRCCLRLTSDLLTRKAALVLSRGMFHKWLSQCIVLRLVRGTCSPPEQMPESLSSNTCWKRNRWHKICELGLVQCCLGLAPPSSCLNFS